MAPAQTVEEFRVATRSLLKLLGAGKPLTEVEESIIVAKIDALRVEFPDWKKRRRRIRCSLVTESTEPMEAS